MEVCHRNVLYRVVNTCSVEHDRSLTSTQRRLYAAAVECTVCGWLRVYFGVGTKRQRVGFGGWFDSVD